MFFVDDVEPDVGQAVTFTNESQNAKRFEWDFGDGYGSKEANPVHYYTATGTYDVIMTAFSKSGLEDKATITIKVMVPTLLVVEVVEYYDEYVVPGASVRLYPTLPDWENERNLEAEGITDKYGIAVFSHLDPFIYYVDVWENDHDNYLLKVENVSFIRTPEVMPNKINWFVAWVDVADHSKGEGKSDKSMTVRKFERKPIDKNRPGTFSDEDWQKLYDRSIKIKKGAVSR
jgi:PKD repeat protein